jgi:hypothetical protein
MAMNLKALSILPLLAVLVPMSVTTTGCAVEEEDEAPMSEDDLQAKQEDHWFYTGEMPALVNPKLTVSLKGHTVRVNGTLPAGTVLPDLPHVRKAADGSINVVYPIATAAAGSSNSREATYSFYNAKPYRPSGIATNSSGTSYVPWGGFPFLGYNNGIAFHGPITATKDAASVWFLRRGRVSHGCNRMNGEHAVELAHILGLPMRKIYPGNTEVPMPSSMKNSTVKVIADYDMLDGKFIDVDYPTDTGTVRPGKVHGDLKVVMFGSWIATETPDGKDLPPDMKWEGGRAGDFYVFSEHARSNSVCSAPKSTFAALKTFAASQPGGLLPKNFCEKKSCYIANAKAGRNLASCNQ